MRQREALCLKAERAGFWNLLEVANVVGVDAGCELKKVQRVLDVASVAQDQSFDIQRVLGKLVDFLQRVFDECEALIPVLAHIQLVDEIVALLPLLWCEDLILQH